MAVTWMRHWVCGTKENIVEAHLFHVFLLSELPTFRRTRFHYWIHGGHVDASLGVWYEREGKEYRQKNEVTIVKK